MTATQTSIPTSNYPYSEQILCGYVNATSRIQIARITNIPNRYFERVVFPGERLFFEALPKAQLEIHTSKMASVILADNIPCDRLRVQEISRSLGTTHSQKA